MVNEEFYGLGLRICCGFGVRIAYLSAPAMPDVTRRPILPIRQEALSSELPTTEEVIEDLTWGITEAVTRWGVNFGPKTDGNTQWHAMWDALAKQHKRASGKAVLLKMASYGLGINPTVFSLMIDERVAGGHIGYIVAEEEFADITKLTKPQIAKLAKTFGAKIHPMIIKQMKALAKKR